jgi:LAO/AO transport system kinase
VSPSPAEVQALADRVAAREPGAVARAVSLVEDRRAGSEPAIVALLRALTGPGRTGACHRVGITGPPGVGKSSLVSALALEARRRGRTVAVLAVDPSSPRSGGALLGDRARIEIDPDDQGLFVRSMASGGDLGGLARAAGAAVDVLGAAYDLVLVETTGVGQSETDVEHVTDTVVMVVQPGSGDVLQFLKAGIIEIPDVFVVNKADLGEIATRARADLGAALGAAHAGTGQEAPRIVSTSAASRQGVADLLDALEAHREQTAATADGLTERRRGAAARWALRLCVLRYGEYGAERAGGTRALERALRAEIDRGATAVEAVATARAWCVSGA